MPSLTQPLILRPVVLRVLRPLSWMMGSRMNDPRGNGLQPATAFKTCKSVKLNRIHLKVTERAGRSVHRATSHHLPAALANWAGPG